MVNRSGYRIMCFKIRIYIFKICVLALYRALTGNFDQFLNTLETIPNVLHSPKI